MKQIDIIKTYSQKRCLVIDDNADIRTALKRLLVDFGSNEVDTAGHAEEAISLCEKNNYDIVLSDYNLGKGKNGQQVLEELRHNKLLKHSAIYMMITAEAGVQHVVHALEHAPDDFLSKPINRDSLRPRLDAALLKNEALLPVKKALDVNRPKTAIGACRDLIEHNSKYKTDAMKLLGELLCQYKQYDEALALYESFGKDTRVLWAKLGWATALLGLKKFEEAEKLLTSLVEENEYCVEALDLLAKAYEGRNKFEQAQHTLASAVKISPMSPARQREMGRISAEAGDENAAIHAFKAAIKNSRNSVQESPEDYTSLASSLHQVQKKDPQDAQKITIEALECLKLLDKKYAHQPVVQLRKKLLEADIYHAAGREDKAEKCNEEAMSTFENLRFTVVEKTSTKLSIDCAKALMERGKSDEGERLLQEVANLNKDPELAIKIDKLLREPITKEGIAHAATLNKKGIEFHKKNQFEKAVDAFQKVLHDVPNHIGLNLNLIQTLISKSKETPLSESEISQMKSSFKRIGVIRDDSTYKERHSYLLKRFEKLAEQTTS